MLEAAHHQTALAAVVAAARAAARTIGHGDPMASDRAAVDAMRLSLSSAQASLRVVIGEGERDKAPMLYIGEELGLGGDALDLALDPLEGTSLAAAGKAGALTVLAVARRGGLLHAPDVYMEKLAFGAGIPAHALHLDMSPSDLVAETGKVLGLPASEVRVAILERERHRDLEEALRSTGCRLHLFGDGDVAACLATSLPHAAYHLYVGSGGAPEGVLSAAALRCLGGHLQARLIFRDDDERARATAAGITDFARLYSTQDLASGDLAFAATGVTTGPLLDGICIAPEGDWSESLLLASSGDMHRLRSFHRTQAPSA